MKRYISIFMPAGGNLGQQPQSLGKHLGTYDSKTKRWTQLDHRMKDANGKFEPRIVAYLGAVGLSHNSTSWDGPYERNAKGEILAGHIPERLTTEQVEAALKPKPSQRGKNPKSLANLTSHKMDKERWHPLKSVSQFDEDDFGIVQVMRDAGCTWAQVGMRLNRHPAAIKTAFWRRNRNARGLPIRNLFWESP